MLHSLDYRQPEHGKQQKYSHDILKYVDQLGVLPEKQTNGEIARLRPARYLIKRSALKISLSKYYTKPIVYREVDNVNKLRGSPAI
jgi:hypothetical protein